MAALDLVGDLELHVVAEVVEAELVVGAVGDVGGVGVAALLVGEVVDDDADGEAEEAVDLAHPLGVALGEVVVDGDDVDAASGEGVEVAGEGGDEGLAFAGLHLGDLALVEDVAAEELDVEVAHADGALAGFADDGKGLGEDFVEGGFFGGVDGGAVFVGAVSGVEVRPGGFDAGLEFGGFASEFVVGEGGGGGVEGVDLLDGGEEALDGALVGGAEDFGDDGVEHGWVSLGLGGTWGCWVCAAGFGYARSRPVKLATAAEAEAGWDMNRGARSAALACGLRSRTGAGLFATAMVLGLWGCAHCQCVGRRGGVEDLSRDQTEGVSLSDLHGAGEQEEEDELGRT